MKKIFLYFLLMGFLFSACEDSLEVAPPNNLTDEMIQEILASGDEENGRIGGNTGCQFQAGR